MHMSFRYVSKNSFPAAIDFDVNIFIVLVVKNRITSCRMFSVLYGAAVVNIEIVNTRNIRKEKKY